MRSYLESHPWITFEATDINDLGAKTWMLLGEARSKCEHLAGVPLPPEVAKNFYTVALVKGAQATTAIEGNTLTEEQVAGILDGSFKAPPSRAYQEREVRNVLEALQEIADDVMRGSPRTITEDLICEFNERLLDGTEHEPDAVPGVVRDHAVAVADYRGAPAEDCDFLLGRLAEWLESDTFKSEDPEVGFALAVVCAVYAHLYMAWLHPFGDGNGRTARLLEFLILARSGLAPLPAAHLLSNHYNLTRDQYYRELAQASRSSSTVSFVTYAIRGFADGLREQINQVRAVQLQVAWVNYVHEVMNRFPSSPARDRQRALVLAMPSDRDVPKSELPLLTPELAAKYATTGPRTLSRDLNRLDRAELVRERRGGWSANHSIIAAFLPPVAESNS
ncbi:MAG: Fic family protein [Acidimicrobiaceae bacterium]|nr:Fic family protein [Acidimicrobiaceae bacterium]MDE0493970.1 Fic family protein [Acidimicrobiaceae bacterium]